MSRLCQRDSHWQEIASTWATDWGGWKSLVFHQCNRHQILIESGRSGDKGCLCTAGYQFIPGGKKQHRFFTRKPREADGNWAAGQTVMDVVKQCSLFSPRCVRMCVCVSHVMPSVREDGWWDGETLVTSKCRWIYDCTHSVYNCRITSILHTVWTNFTTWCEIRWEKKTNTVEWSRVFKSG